MLHWTQTRTALRASCQLALLVLAACSRSGLEPFDVDDEPPAAPGAAEPDGGSNTPPLDASTPPPDASSDVDASIPPACSPEPETCNGVDDDCNGRVDETAPAPCPGGGFRYCVAGRESACPERCESCVPGTERVCFISYCTFWGVQTCSADGRGFGRCQEQRAPSVCSRYATGRGDIDRLERCCIDAGYCCVDEEDLDADGDRREMLGRCDHVVCR